MPLSYVLDSPTISLKPLSIMNPILRRDLLDILRTRKALAMQLCLAVACAILVVVRWPTAEVTDLSGARSLQVLRVFGYGLMAGILVLVPAGSAPFSVPGEGQRALSPLLHSP